MNKWFYFLWPTATVRVLVPGAIYCQWSWDWIDRDNAGRFAGTVILVYLAANVATIVSVIIALVKINRTELPTPQLLAFVVGVFLSFWFLIVGYFGLVKYVGEFVAG